MTWVDATSATSVVGNFGRLIQVSDYVDPSQQGVDFRYVVASVEDARRWQVTSAAPIAIRSYDEEPV